MFCSNCGAQLNDGASFCAKCGAPAARVVNAKAINPAQIAVPINTQERLAKGRKFGKAALILGIAAIVLSLAFAPFVYRAFSEQKMTMTGEDWLLAIFTLFIAFIVKIFGALLEGLASAVWFILPCVVLQFTGLLLALIGRVAFKDKKLSTPAIIVNASGILVQVIIFGICVAAIQ